MAKIIDTTLREGEQTPGVSFSLQQKKEIIDGLRLIGISEIEVGIASVLHDCPKHLIGYCRSKHPATATLLWARCSENDIYLASANAPDILSLSIPVSDLLIRDKLEKDRSWVEMKLQKCLLLTKRAGIRAMVGFEDATRAEPEYLIKLALLAEKCGAERIRIADTVGNAAPLQIANLVKRLAASLNSCEISIHTHNDFGMATANAVTALASGASCADATVLGLGERSGCARLEELAGFLTLQTDAKYNLRQIPPLSRYVAQITSRRISAARPFLGRDIFTCETGLHLHALQKNLKTYEPYPPERIGRRHKLVVGEKAGKKAIVNHLTNTGFSLPPDLTDTQVHSIRRLLQAGLRNQDQLNEILEH